MLAAISRIASGWYRSNGFRDTVDEDDFIQDVCLKLLIKIDKIEVQNGAFFYLTEFCKHVYWNHARKAGMKRRKMQEYQEVVLASLPASHRPCFKSP